MKAVPVALQAHYDSGCTTLAQLWKITRSDGAVFAFTDHDRPLDFSGTTYEPSSAFIPGANSTRSELNVDTLEAIGLLDSAGITADDIEAGLWDGASIELRIVNWANLTDGAEIEREGTLGEVQRKAPGQFVAELRGLMQALQNTIGRAVFPTCDARLGDARCGIDLDALEQSSAVDSITTARRRFVAGSLTGAAGTFNGGLVTFTAGLNDGISREVKTHLDLGGGDADLEVHLPFPYDLTVADTFTVTPGCDKTFPTCRDTFSNAARFRGFPDVPGPDQVLKVGGQ